VFGGLVFGSFFGVLFSLYMVAMRQMSVMAGLFVIACFVVFCCIEMMVRSLLMMLRCLAMMFGALVRHRKPLFVVRSLEST
jgi:hypothetical protein